MPQCDGWLDSDGMKQRGRAGEGSQRAAGQEGVALMKS